MVDLERNSKQLDIQGLFHRRLPYAHDGGTGDDGKGEEKIVFPSISHLTTIPARHYGEVRENWGRVRSKSRIVNTIVIQRKNPLDSIEQERRHNWWIWNEFSCHEFPFKGKVK